MTLNIMTTLKQKKQKPAGIHDRNYRAYWRKWDWVKSHLGDCCALCESKEKLTLDHIDPLLKTYKGRTIKRSYHDLSQELGNLRILCHDCHDRETGYLRTEAATCFNLLTDEDQKSLLTQCQGNWKKAHWLAFRSQKSC